MIKTNWEALNVLGLKPGTTIEEIKSTYHKLMKAYHPDANGESETNPLVFRIQEAYDYLLDHYNSSYYASNHADFENRKQESTKVYGSTSSLKQAATKRQQRADRQKAEERLKKRQEEKREAFLQEAEKQRQERAYQEAMDRIHAIRAGEVAAEIIQAMIRGDIK
ncbi:MAG: DnaJ domain-containing protein [Lachnospiraceae bacterium]|nr:DnaJ domain-containing protein [Lachnospiraceae bacterium]